MRSAHFTSSSSWLACAAWTLDRHGMDGARVLAESGICLGDWDRDGRRAPTDVIRDAWKLVAEKTGDPAIGIRAALEHFNPADWQSLGLAILCSETIRQALERVVRYFEVVTDAGETWLEEKPENLRFVASVFGDPMDFGQEAIEFGLGALLVMLREISPRPLRPLRVELFRPEPSASKEFSILLGCPVIFGCEHESILFPAAIADEKSQRSNEALAQYQDSFSKDYIERFGNASISMAVRKEVLRSLPGGNPSEAAIARALNISVRHMQRKLQLEESSFRTILTDVRKKLAAAYLSRPDLELSEIAYLLGFTDHSNFSRAFRCWYDTSPSALRKTLQSAND